MISSFFYWNVTNIDIRKWKLSRCIWNFILRNKNKHCEMSSSKITDWNWNYFFCVEKADKNKCTLINLSKSLTLQFTKIECFCFLMTRNYVHGEEIWLHAAIPELKFAGLNISKFWKYIFELLAGFPQAVSLFNSTRIYCIHTSNRCERKWDEMSKKKCNCIFTASYCGQLLS